MERFVSCLLICISQIFLDELDVEDVWMPEESLAARAEMTQAMTQLKTTLQSTLWPTFMAVSDKIEKVLKSSATRTGGSLTRSSKLLPPALAQVVPVAVSYFDVFEGYRLLTTPLEVLRAELALKGSEEGFCTQEKAVALAGAAAAAIAEVAAAAASRDASVSRADKGPDATAAAAPPSTSQRWRSMSLSERSMSAQLLSPPPAGVNPSDAPSSSLPSSFSQQQHSLQSQSQSTLQQPASLSPTKHPLNIASATSASALLSKATGEATILRFVERHRRMINLLVYHDSNLLTGPLAILIRNPRLLEFDNKRAFFRSRIKELVDVRRVNHGPFGSIDLSVRRAHLFEDSFNQLRHTNPEAFRSKLKVTFSGEEGVDAGGLRREWFQLMSREMFNPAISLFCAVPEGTSTFQPNPNSEVQSDPGRGTSHLDYFSFVGRVVGKALHDNELIDAHFTRSLYKHMLGMPLSYQDIEAVDPDYYKNLEWMLSNDITDVVELVFAEEADYFGRKSLIELIPGGAHIKVDNENKREYVDLVAQHRMTTAIRGQIDAFLKGFWQVVPQSIIGLFNDHELELIMCGLPDVDVDDLQAHTIYENYTANTPVIRWFWEVVREMEREDRALLLQFVTGTAKVPLDGFKGLQGLNGAHKFGIHKYYEASNAHLPKAHTCFNQLDLPEYDSKEVLKERLLMAIREGSEGFAFA